MTLNTKKTYKIEPARIRDINRIVVSYRGDNTTVAKRPPKEDIRASNGKGGKAPAKEGGTRSWQKAFAREGTKVITTIKHPP